MEYNSLQLMREIDTVVARIQPALTDTQVGIFRKDGVTIGVNASLGVDPEFVRPSLLASQLTSEYGGHRDKKVGTLPISTEVMDVLWKHKEPVIHRRKLEEISAQKAAGVILPLGDLYHMVSRTALSAGTEFQVARRAQRITAQDPRFVVEVPVAFVVDDRDRVQDSGFSVPTSWIAYQMLNLGALVDDKMPEYQTARELLASQGLTPQDFDLFFLAGDQSGTMAVIDLEFCHFRDR